MERRRKKTSGKKGFVFLLLIFVVLVLSIGGYFYFYDSPNDEELPSIEEPEKPKVQIVDEEAHHRPFGVMINNIGVARKLHSGLQSAYLVYEMIVEGGITRFYALFSDVDVDRIGPIRSARPYYLDYAMENDAYFVHWGFSDQAKNDISKYRIQNINGLYQSKYFWKDNSLSVASEHRAFTSMEKLQEAVSDLNYRTDRRGSYLFSYSAVDQDVSNREDVLQANEVQIPYSNGTKTKYVYQPEEKVYYRYVNDEVHQDYVTKKQYTVKNIITYQVKNTSIDPYGRQKLDNVSSGTGYYITNGNALPIKWSKSSREGKTTYTYLDGSEVILNDGNTWIQIQPSNQRLTIS